MDKSLLIDLMGLPEQEQADFINRLSPLQVRNLLSELDQLYKEEPLYWFMYEVFTQDEATQAKLPWPDKLYLKDLIYILNTEHMIAIPKSRRLMVSWLMSAWAVYKARYFPHNAAFIQSETEDKAAYITDKRCAYIESNLREPLLRRKYRAIKTAKGSIGRITYENTGSYIWAIPQGDDAIRSFTFSILIMDESEFQAEGVKALVSALPTAEKGAQLIIASTSNGPMGILADICREVGFSKFTG